MNLKVLTVLHLITTISLFSSPYIIHTCRYRETLEYMYNIYNIYKQSFISSNLVRGTHSLIDDFDEFTQAYKTVIYATISILFHSHFTTHFPHHQPPDSICLDGLNSIYLWISDFRPHQIHSRAVMLHTRQVVHLLLMLSGQVELNPGPYTPKFPCQICSKAVKWGQRALACDNCDQWCHTEFIKFVWLNHSH